VVARRGGRGKGGEHRGGGSLPSLGEKKSSEWKRKGKRPPSKNEDGAPGREEFTTEDTESTEAGEKSARGKARAHPQKTRMGHPEEKSSPQR